MYLNLLNNSKMDVGIANALKQKTNSMKVY